MEVNDFSAKVKLVFETQDQLKAIVSREREEKKELREKINQLEADIMAFMNEKRLSVCNYNDQKLELIQQERKNALNKQSLADALTEYFSEDGRRPAEADELFEFIMEHLGVKQIERLRRVQIKQKKTKK